MDSNCSHRFAHKPPEYLPATFLSDTRSLCFYPFQKLFFSCFRVLFREITRLIHFAFPLNSNSVNPLSCYLIILYLFPFLLAVPVPSSSFLLLLLILYVFLFLHRLYPKFFSSTLSIPVVHSIYINLFIFSKVLMLFTN